MKRRQKERLIENLRDRAYRHSFFAELLNGSIAAQIKANRERRKWTQADLAKKADTHQSRISAMENVNYESWSVKSLRRLAEAFDAALVVRFVSFSKALKVYDSFSSEALVVPSFDDDIALLNSAQLASRLSGSEALGEAIVFEFPGVAIPPKRRLVEGGGQEWRNA